MGIQYDHVSCDREIGHLHTGMISHFFCFHFQGNIITDTKKSCLPKRLMKQRAKTCWTTASVEQPMSIVDLHLLIRVRITTHLPSRIHGFLQKWVNMTDFYCQMSSRLRFECGFDFRLFARNVAYVERFYGNDWRSLVKQSYNSENQTEFWRCYCTQTVIFFWDDFSMMVLKRLNASSNQSSN